MRLPRGQDHRAGILHVVGAAAAAGEERPETGPRSGIGGVPGDSACAF